MLDHWAGWVVLTHRARQGGATLIELMIGLVIVGFVTVAAAPSFAAWIANSKIRTATEALQNGLQVARNEAIRRNASVAFTLGTGSGWGITVVSTGETLQSRVEEDGSKNVTVDVLPAGARTVTFTAFGRVASVNADGTVPFTQLDIDVPTSVLSAADSRNMRIVTGGGGQVRMCDPNVVLSTDSRKC